MIHSLNHRPNFGIRGLLLKQIAARTSSNFDLRWMALLYRPENKGNINLHWKTNSPKKQSIIDLPKRPWIIQLSFVLSSHAWEALTLTNRQWETWPCGHFYLIGDRCAWCHCKSTRPYSQRDLAALLAFPSLSSFHRDCIGVWLKFLPKNICFFIY